MSFLCYVKRGVSWKFDLLFFIFRFQRLVLWLTAGHFDNGALVWRWFDPLRASVLLWRSQFHFPPTRLTDMMMMMTIYILWCMCVCLSRKMITSSWESPVTTWTPHNHPLQLYVSFDGSRLVFHGSISVFIGFQWFRLVLMVFHGSRLDFHGSRSVFMV